MKKVHSQGFSLVEVVIGVALMTIAFVGMSEVSLQLNHMHEHYVAVSRLETTLANIATDTRAIVRYDGPAAQALQTGLVPSTFTAYQWEPDMPNAPIRCVVQHLTQPTDMLHLICQDRQGTSAARDIDLDGSQPQPGSVVTSAPSGAS